ncbi:MAG TPA: tetratricopeptide repeat protein [Candidatus Eremiobacteraceae bacterium]
MTDIHDSDTAEAYLAAAKECLRNNDAGGMTEALQRLSAAQDCSASHRFEAAKLYAAAGAKTEAIQSFRESGAAYIDPEGDTGRAREAFTEAQALDQQNLDIIFEIARVDMIEGHPRAALAKFTHILNKSNQSYVPALFESACIHQELGQHDQAVLTFRKVLDRDKNNVQAIVSMGQRLQSMGMVPEAVGYFMQAATAANAAGQMGTCRHVINMVIALEPNNAQARSMLAEMEELPDPADVHPGDLSLHPVRRRDLQQVRAPAAGAPNAGARAPASTASARANLAFEAELDELGARNDRMQRKISASAGVVAELEETVASLKIEVGELKSKMATSAAKVPDVKTAIDAAVAGFEATLASLKADVADLRSKTPTQPTTLADANLAVEGIATQHEESKTSVRADVKPKATRAAAKTLDVKPKEPSKKSAAAKTKPGKSTKAKAPSPRR